MYKLTGGLTAFNERQDVYKQRPAGDDYSAVYRAIFTFARRHGGYICRQLRRRCGGFRRVARKLL